MALILALDQGTTSSRSILFDHGGSIVASAQRELTQHYPSPGADNVESTRAARWRRCSRSILFDHGGSIVASAQRELTQHYPRPGWVEHDPREIWASQSDTIAQV